MSTYKPPHSRKPKWKIEEERVEKAREREVANTDQNFPALGSATSKPNTWGGAKSFATMAAEWSVLSEEQKEEAEREKLREIRTRVHAPMFYRTRQVTEDVHNTYEDDDMRPLASGDDEWNTIQKKIRPVKPRVEDDLQENIPVENNADKDSMWADDQPKEHETYWDERRS